MVTRVPKRGPIGEQWFWIGFGLVLVGLGLGLLGHKLSGLKITIQILRTEDKMGRMMVSTWRQAMSASVLNRSASSRLIPASALRSLKLKSEK